MSYNEAAIAAAAKNMAAVLCPSAAQDALEIICPLCARSAISRLLPEADCESELTAAVAYLSAATAISGMSDSSTSVKAGELSIATSPAGAAAASAALRMEAERLLRPFVADTGFVFREVRG